MDYDVALNSFEEYVKQFNMQDKLYFIKYDHTYRVVRLMEKLAKRLRLSDEEVILAKIIGLLHDIGRFKQIEISGKVNDLETNLDHALLGCDYLFKENHIRDFISDTKYDEIVKNAIMNHNKLTLDDKMDEKSLLFSKMIRDMDKVDIFRVLAVYFEFELIKEEVNKDILNGFKEKTLINQKKVKSDSDSTLSYLSYIYDINFKESYELLDETDNLGLYISSLNIPKYSEEFASEIFECVNKKLQEGMENE